MSSSRHDVIVFSRRSLSMCTSSLLRPPDSGLINSQPRLHVFVSTVGISAVAKGSPQT